MRRPNDRLDAQKLLHSVELDPGRAYEAFAVEHEQLLAATQVGKLARPHQHVQVVDAVANELVLQQACVEIQQRRAHRRSGLLI